MESIKQILTYTRGLRGLFIIITLTSILGALIALVQPFIIKLATDWITNIITGKATFDMTTVLMYGGIAAAATLVSALISDIGGYAGDQMSTRTHYQLSVRYFEHLLKLPQNYYDNETTGKIINRLSRAINNITGFLQFFSNNLLQMLLVITITICILFYYSWPLAVLFALLVPSSLYLTARTSGPWQKLEKRKNEHFDIASSRFAEVVGQIRLVKSFRTEQNELRNFSHEMGKVIPLTQKQSRRWHTMNAMRTGTMGLINGGILALLIYETSRGNMTLGDMAMLITLTTQASFPIRNLSFFVDNYQRAVTNSKDYIDALNEKPETDDTDNPSLAISKGEVEYRGVNFAYSKKENVLSDVSFTIQPGTKLALVGESGGGKTTISNLLMGLYTPKKGTVAIDGQDISGVTRQSLRENIATVFQDPALFSGTIRENIAYARPSASDSDIIEAAKAANAYEFIMKFKDGMDTEIGERGIKLSGGQKQRISIARAILKNAPILILDEATSSLDSRAEHEVQQALDRLMVKRTTLIIAHRLSTIANVDTIVTLRDGKIDEIGSPKQLAKSGGIYAQLLKLHLGNTETAKKKLEKFDIAE